MRQFVEEEIGKDLHGKDILRQKILGRSGDLMFFHKA
jgi:hypothetical protein